MKKEKSKRSKDKDRAASRSIAQQLGAQAAAREPSVGGEDKKKTRSKSKSKKEKPVDMNLTIDDLNNKKKKKKKDKDSASEKSDKKDKKKKKKGESAEKGNKAGGAAVAIDMNNLLTGMSNTPGQAAEGDEANQAKRRNNQDMVAPAGRQSMMGERASEPGEQPDEAGESRKLHPSHRGTVRKKKEKKPQVIVADNLLDEQGNLIEDADHEQAEDGVGAERRSRVAGERMGKKQKAKARHTAAMEEYQARQSLRRPRRKTKAMAEEYGEEYEESEPDRAAELVEQLNQFIAETQKEAEDEEATVDTGRAGKEDKKDNKNKEKGSEEDASSAYHSDAVTQKSQENLGLMGYDQDEDPYGLIEPEVEVFEKDDETTPAGQLSYKAVKEWQNKMHPRDPETKEPYSWWDADLKYMPLFACQVKKSEWVTEEARAIGLGPVLFLHTMKALAYLFLFFSLVNIPLFMFYLRGEPSAEDGVEPARFTDVFGRLSMGALGVSGFACSNFNIAKGHKEFYLHCPSGTIRELFEFGMQKIDNQSCVNRAGDYLGEGGATEDLQIDCNLKHGLTEKGKTEMLASFDEQCFDQQTCEFSIKLEWFTSECMQRIEYYALGSKFDTYAKSQGWLDYQRDGRRREPVFFGVAFCVSDKVYHPLSGELLQMSKMDLGYWITLVDGIVVLASILAINLFHSRYLQYAKVFDKRNVEMRDFTVLISNLPYDYQYGAKDMMLQAHLWQHIEQQVQDSFEAPHLQSNNQVKLSQLRQQRPWELVDLNFSKIDSTEADLLINMNKSLRLKKRTILEQMKLQKGPDADKQQEKIDKLNSVVAEQIAIFKENKKKYIEIQEEKLYEKYEITEENGRSKKDRNINYCFATFKSMKGKIRCETEFFDCEALAKDNPEENNKMFMINSELDKQKEPQFLKVREAKPPGAIQWHNISYSWCNRRCRSTCLWILALIFVIGAFALVLYFKEWNDSLTASAGLQTKCAPLADAPDIEMVYDDYMKAPKQRDGLVHCYCLAYLNEYGTIEGTKAKFLAIDANLKGDPCGDWLPIYQNSFYLTIITGALIGAVNGIVVAIFENIAPLEKCLTWPGENLGTFQRICLVQFLNLGAVFIFSDFSIGLPRDETGLPPGVLAGRYRDFDTDWFNDIGAKVAIAMISNSVAPHAGKIAEPFVQKLLLRYVLDRCCKKHLRKKSNLEGEEAEKKDPEEQEQQEGGRSLLPDQKGSQRQLMDELYEGGLDGSSERPSRSQREEDSPEADDQDQYNDDDDEWGDDDDEQRSDQRHEDQEARSLNEVHLEVGDKPKGQGTQQQQAEVDPDAIGDDDVETRHVFQDELNRAYTGLPVASWYLYAWFFTNLMIYYLYGGGMPIMYLLGVLFFCTSYLNYKWLFFFWHPISHGFNEDIALHSLGLMKWAVLCHLCMSLFMYSNRRVLTPKDYTPAEHYRPKGEDPVRFLRRRFDRAQPQVVAAMFLGLLFLYFFWRIIIKTIHNIFVVRKKRRKQHEDDEGPQGGDEEAQKFRQQNIEDESDDFYRELTIASLQSHYVRANKEYEQFRTMLNALCYDDSMLSEEAAKAFKKTLKTRIHMIEDTIDIHLNLIGGLERYLERSYMYKLRVLLANEEVLRSKDSRALRLTDRMQSYNIYDSELFHQEKLLLNQIDREMLELEYLECELPVVC